MSKSSYEAKHVRGVVLTTLQAYYPNGLSGGNVFKHGICPLFPTMEWQEVFRHLVYLKDRGFTEVVKPGELQDIDSSRDIIYRLAPAGLDLAAGVTQDPAVLIDA